MSTRVTGVAAARGEGMRLLRASNARAALRALATRSLRTPGLAHVRSSHVAPPNGSLGADVARGVKVSFPFEHRVRVPRRPARH